MVVSSIVQLAVAGATGFLFGISYGTAIRIGYEQVYPALFSDSKIKPDMETIFTKLEDVYTKIGGLEAHKFGINQGIKNALKDIDADPELVELIKKNLLRDTLNITVNSPGISKDDSGDSSSGGSSKGGAWSAELHKRVRQAHALIKFENAKTKTAALVQEYTIAVKLVIKNQFPNGWTFGWLTSLTTKPFWVMIPGGTFSLQSYPAFQVIWGFLTLDYQKDLANQFNEFKDDSLKKKKEIVAEKKRWLPCIMGWSSFGTILKLKEHCGLYWSLEKFTTFVNGKKGQRDSGWLLKWTNYPKVKNKIILGFINYESIFKNWEKLKTG